MLYHHYKGFVKRLYARVHGDEEQVYLTKISIQERRIAFLTKEVATLGLEINSLQRTLADAGGKLKREGPWV